MELFNRLLDPGVPLEQKGIIAGMLCNMPRNDTVLGPLPDLLSDLSADRLLESPREVARQKMIVEMIQAAHRLRFDYLAKSDGGALALSHKNAVSSLVQSSLHPSGIFVFENEENIGVKFREKLVPAFANLLSRSKEDSLRDGKSSAIASGDGQFALSLHDSHAVRYVIALDQPEVAGDEVEAFGAMAAPFFNQSGDLFWNQSPSSITVAS